MADESYCSYQITLMKYIGGWPLETKSVLIKMLQILFRTSIMVILFIASICLTGAALFSNDLNEVASTVDIATLTISALYKLAFTTYYMKQFKQLINTMNTKFKKVIFNRKGQCISVVQESKHCNEFSTILVLFGVLVTVVYSSTPFLEGGKIGSKYQGNETIYYHMKVYPLHFWLPFNTDSSPVYELVYFIETFSLIGSSCVYMIMDSFFFTMIYQICVQLKMLYLIILNLGMGDSDYEIGIRNVMAEISSSSKKNAKSNYKQEIFTNGKMTKMRHTEQLLEPSDRGYCSESEIDTKLKHCIAFHIDLLNIIEKTERLYRSIILADVVHAIISLSFALHETGISDSVYERIKMYMFLIICIIHQFLNSHYGEMLLNAQENITEALYLSPWSNRHPRHRKYILMMLLRSQKCTKLNGGQMYYLCRQSFVLFVKTLFSYYMVLRQSSSQ